MADKYIRLQDAQDILEMATDDDWEMDYAIGRLSEIPTADVVTRDCYDRILLENDIMRKQLSEIGKSFGEKMDDVKKVVHGRWIDSCDSGSPSSCNICKYQVSKFSKSDFCPCCGSDMRPIENK